MFIQTFEINAITPFETTFIKLPMTILKFSGSDSNWLVVLFIKNKSGMKRKSIKVGQKVNNKIKY